MESNDEYINSRDVLKLGRALQHERNLHVKTKKEEQKKVADVEKTYATLEFNYKQLQQQYRKLERDFTSLKRQYASKSNCAACICLNNNRRIDTLRTRSNSVPRPPAQQSNKENRKPPVDVAERNINNQLRNQLRLLKEQNAQANANLRNTKEQLKSSRDECHQYVQTINSLQNENKQLTDQLTRFASTQQESQNVVTKHEKMTQSKETEVLRLKHDLLVAQGERSKLYVKCKDYKEKIVNLERDIEIQTEAIEKLSHIPSMVHKDTVASQMRRQDATIPTSLSQPALHRLPPQDKDGRCSRLGVNPYCETCAQLRDKLYYLTQTSLHAPATNHPSKGLQNQDSPDSGILDQTRRPITPPSNENHLYNLIESYRSDLKKQRAENVKIREQCDQLRRENQALVERCENLNHQLTTARQPAITTTSNISYCDGLCSPSTQRPCQCYVNGHRRNVEELQDEFAKLTEEINRCEKDKEYIKILESRMAELEREKNSLAQRLDESVVTTQSLPASSKEFERLQQAYNDLHTKYCELEQETRDYMVKNRSVERDLERLERERKRRDDTLAMYGIEINEQLKKLTLCPPTQTSSQDVDRFEFDLSLVRNILLRDRTSEDNMAIDSIRSALQHSNVAQQDLRSALEKERVQMQKTFKDLTICRDALRKSDEARRKYKQMVLHLKANPADADDMTVSSSQNSVSDISH